MVIMHIALQGCLKTGAIEYGITADTGGHIQYLLQLAHASAADPDVDRIDIVTRAFACDFSSHDYAAREEWMGDKIRLVRIATDQPGYLDKTDLASELPVFITRLIALIDAMPRAPDFLHAHFADAAEVATGVKQALGIPFVFTAHSLGRVKARHLRGAIPATLARRIGFEERALREAALVFASSRDEAELQYGGYAAYDPGRIRILAPGIDAERFEAASADGIDALVAPFLRAPDKPVILAIARPVARKNLAGLVRAYGASPQLRERANLVIVAGTRQRLDTLEPETQAGFHELLALIDDHDLYGHVALPKQHAPRDIPNLYAWARERGGVFVNAAFNEPFGLTLLEAAAAGLPVVATDSGGPNDIVSHCGHGLLVPAADEQALARAIHALITDRSRWTRLAENGRRAVGDYDWGEHARRYHGLLTDLQRCDTPLPVATDPRLLICDIDGTLIGCPKGIAGFNAWQQDQEGLVLAVATGRSFHSALDVLEQAGISRPRFLITSVGSELYRLSADATTYTRDAAWPDAMARRWPREAIEALLADHAELVPQSPLEQRPCKLSYLTADDPTLRERIEITLARAGLPATVIHSHERYLDILPPGVSKAGAVAYLRRTLGLAAERVIVAGDSGNDIDMLRASHCSIIVGNARAELTEQSGLGHAYRARASHGRGVVEGMQFFMASPGIAP